MRTFALALLLAGTTGVVAAQTVPAFDRDDYTAAAAPRAITYADFNRDGWLDIATAGTGRGSVGILLSNGSAGGFRALPERVIGGGPFEIAAGDLNRDGTPDLVVANADADGIDILIGAGDGTFPGWSRVPIPSGNPRGVTLADYDRDGKLDIIATEYATGAWRILYGDGAGFITRQHRFGAIANPQGVAAADFNRDGRLDVAIAGAGINRVAIFYSTPDGIVQRNVTVGGAVNVLTFGDYNHDGWLDLSAASTSNSRIYTLQGGSGGLAWTRTTVSGSSPRGIVAADVNQDGWLDLVTANRASSAVNVHLGIPSTPGAFTAAYALGAGSGSRAIAAADFDHDGRVDLASANEFGSSTTLLRNITTFVAPAFRFTQQSFEPSPGSYGPYGLVTADFDRNGRLDVAIGANGVTVWLAGRGKTVLSPDVVSDVAVADFNGDGASDIATTDFFQQRIIVYLNRGDGTFVVRPPIPSTLPLSQLESADFNRDGRADIVFENVDELAGHSLIGVLLGRGDGTFTATATSDVIVPFLRELVVGDVDADGAVDVAGASEHPSSFVVWYGKGDGTPSRLASYEIPRGAVDVALADLNEDGRLDLISAYDTAVFVRLGLPGRDFAPPVEHLALLRKLSNVLLNDVGVGDVNLDGHVDVVTNDADILFGNGDGSFTFDARSGFEGYYQDPTVVDYNGDGLPDLLFVEGGGLIVMLNERGGTNRPPTVSAGPDRTVSYLTPNGHGEDFSIDATGSDPDLHELRYEWRDQHGALLSTDQILYPSNLPDGRYTFTVIAYDGRGGRASDSMVLTVEPYQEIYFHSNLFGEPRGAWRRQDDPAAASGTLLRHPNANAPKLTAPLASPANYIEANFQADPSQIYKLWLRLKADSNHWGNDSVFVQFDGATDEHGTPVYQIGTTSALAVNLEECSGCGLSAWGWEDEGWGAKDLNGTARLRFPRGFGVIRIQTREDGVAMDQVVLSAKKYLSTRPGLAKNDRTILPVTVPLE